MRFLFCFSLAVNLQDTYVVFGTADTDRSGSEVGLPPSRKAASTAVGSAAVSGSREVSSLVCSAGGRGGGGHTGTC